MTCVTFEKFESFLSQNVRIPVKIINNGKKRALCKLSLKDTTRLHRIIYFLILICLKKYLMLITKYLM